MRDRVSKIARSVSWRATRMWVGEHAGILLVVVLTIYLLGFFFYHAFAPVDDLLWQEAVRYHVGDGCVLLVEYPTQLPLEISEQAARPITLRLWYAQGMISGAIPLSATCSSTLELISYTAQLGPLGKGLEFADEDGNLASATAPLNLSLSESSARPVRLYVRHAPTAGLAPISLEVQVQAGDVQGHEFLLSTIPEDGSSPLVYLESERASRWRHFLEVLFNPGPLQWMFSAVAGIVGVWEVYKNLQQQREDRREKAVERRRIQRERIEALRDALPSERAFRTYRSLLAEFERDRDMLEELRTAFDPGWLPHLRQHLGHYLRAGQLDEARHSLQMMAWEWRQATGRESYLMLQTLIQHLQAPGTVPTEEVLQQVLEGFRKVGLEAVQPIVEWLTKIQPDWDLVEDILFRNGGAGGRYLLRRWGERDQDVASLLQKWEREALPLLGGGGDAVGLWPRVRGESQLMQQGIHRLGLDFNPFGPEKAEQDPMLPDLFYRLSPVWEEATAPQASILIAPPGCGRSTLIWMIRQESGLMGSSVGEVFSVFVPLYSFASSEELSEMLQRSISAALCRVLACDPYAFLGVEDAERVGLAELLLRANGGLVSLLRQLAGAGLSFDDPDGQLLQESLATAAHARDKWEGGMGWDIPRFHPYGLEYTFLLVDASFQDEERVNILLESLFDRWLPSWAPRHVIPKVFLSSEPVACPITPVWIEWTKDDLRALLRHRLQRAGLVWQRGQPALAGWIEGMDDPDAALIDKAAGSPASLIRLGNRLIRRSAQPSPVTREEFMDIVKGRVDYCM